jgi:uncharacterized protein YkwD
MDPPMSLRPLLLLLLSLAPFGAQAQSFAEQVLELTNDERWNNGQLPPLKGHVQLDASSTLHSTNMALRDFFMHCDPDTGKGHGTRMSEAGYAWNSAAENIGAGYSSPAAAMAGWMGSTGHRASILSTAYNEIGIGYYYEGSDSVPKRTTSTGCTPTTTMSGAYRHYWTQNFGRRSGGYPLVIAREDYQTSACSVDLYVYGSGFATQMRFSNDGGGSWSAWQPYDANTTWTLRGSAGGTATVSSQIRNGAGTMIEAADSIRLAVACGAGGADPALVFEHGFETP